MIDEKNLIDAIWDIYNSRYNNASIFDTDETNLINKVLGEIQALIDEQPKVGQWIPCSVKMPEEPGEYYVTCGDKVVIAMMPCNANRFFIESKIAEKKGIKGKPITAWMPLPKPYEPPLETQVCTNKECSYNTDKECPAWLG